MLVWTNPPLLLPRRGQWACFTKDFSHSELRLEAPIAIAPESPQNRPKILPDVNL